MTLEEITNRIKVNNGCWEWQGDSSGQYGRITVNGHYKPAHRAVYEDLVGPIPEGLVIDHLCCNKKCVNPKHLEPVTQRINSLRGTCVSAKNIQKDFCPKGHPYAGKNLRWRLNKKWDIITPWRECRACKNEYLRAYKKRKRLEKRTSSFPKGLCSDTGTCNIVPHLRGA